MFQTSPADFLYFDYRDALLTVIVGERFPKCQRAGASEVCIEAGVPLSQMHWEHGRPTVLNAPTSNPSESDHAQTAG